MKEEHIAAYHARAAMVFWAFRAHSVSRRQFHIKTAISSLQLIPTPLDLYKIWNTLINDLEELD